MPDWFPTPYRITFGGGMVETLVELDKDHTMRIIVEEEAIHLVEPALQKVLNEFHS